MFHKGLKAELGSTLSTDTGVYFPGIEDRIGLNFQPDGNCTFPEWWKTKLI